MGTGAHPSDADREATARPAVLRILEALRRGEPELSRPYWRDDVVWLGPEGRSDGPDAVVRRLGAWEGECFFWGTQSGAELDLLIVHGKSRLGFEFKRTDAPRVTPSMRSALETLDLSSLTVVHAGKDSFPLRANVRAVAAARLLSELKPLRRE